VRTSSASQFVGIWIAVSLAFVAAIGLWGVTIGGALAGSRPAVASTSVPTFTGAGDRILSPSWTYITAATLSCVSARKSGGSHVVMGHTLGSALSALRLENCTK
jgi:hypothetical protein